MAETIRSEAKTLTGRATSLRDQANNVGEFLATTYRRRAAELELQAALLTAQLPKSLPVAA